MKKNFAVLGLGRFGEAVVRTLAEMHQDVLAVDCQEERVNELIAVAHPAFREKLRAEARRCGIG